MPQSKANLPALANALHLRVFRAFSRRIWRAAFGADPRWLVERTREQEARIAAAESALNALPNQITKAEKRIDAGQGRIEKLIESRDELREKLRKANQRADGLKVHLENANKRHEDLAGKVALLERVLTTAGTNPRALWLFANRVERMDAALPIYDEARCAFHLARYHFAAARVDGMRVADIACGPGYGTEILRRDGHAREAVGIDLDPETIAYAAEAHGGEGIRFVCASADATGLPDASFDAVVSFETIEHVPDDRALIAEIARILPPGGLLIISTPNQWPLEVAPCHVREYDRAAFETALAPHFDIEALHNQNSGTPSRFNHGQPVGIVPTTPENQELAECYVAVCRRR